MAIQQNLYGMGNSASGQGEIQACQDQVNQYQSQKLKFQQCINDSMQQKDVPSSVPPTPTPAPKLSFTTSFLPNAIVNQLYSQDINFSYPDGTQPIYIEMTPYYGTELLSDSHIVQYSPYTNNFQFKFTFQQTGDFTLQLNATSSDGTLIGSKTYDITVSTKFDADKSCKDQFGINAIISPRKVGYCACSEGYEFDGNKQCVLTPVTTPAASSQQTAPSQLKTPNKTVPKKPATTLSNLSPSGNAQAGVKPTSWYDQVMNAPAPSPKTLPALKPKESFIKKVWAWFLRLF